MSSAEYLKEWRSRNPEKVKAYARKFYLMNKDRYPYNIEARRAYLEDYHRRIRKEVLTYYGNGKLVCLHCGFSDERALSLDHIDGNGKKDRRESGGSFYARLKKGGYPEGYQTLCMNCQFIKAKILGEHRGRYKDA